MNIKELRQVRKTLVDRFGMDVSAPTTQVAKRLIDEERLFAAYPQDIKQAREFLKEYVSRSSVNARRIKPIPSGVTRAQLGL